MTGDLVPVGQPSWMVLLPAAAELARTIADTDFVPDALRRKPAAIAACVMYGAELGVGPMTALQKIAVIKGRPAPSAELGRALALAAGHRVWVDEATNTRVTVCGQRRGDELVQQVTWSLDDARRAGLVNLGPWRSYPRAMLTARATTELLRTLCPDVLGGITVFAEEANDLEVPADTGDTPPAALQPGPTPPATTKRKRAKPADTVAEPPPAAATAVVDVDLSGPPPALGAPSSTPTAAGPTEEPDSAERAADDDSHGITAAQLRALHAALTAAGIEDRDDRLAFATAVVDRPVDSSKALTRDEASAVIDAAAGVQHGRLSITVTDTGDWQVARVDDEEPE